MSEGPPFEAIAPHTFRIPRRDGMRVDAVFFASREILAGLEAEGFASLKQLINVATLPGILEPALAMPDIHWGYGFPIGGVAAFDPSAGGVVSPGGVGYDINCGVRLLASRLERSNLKDREEALADALQKRIPAGVGSKRATERLSRHDLEGVLEQGAAWMTQRGFGDAEDLAHIEAGGTLEGADPGRVSPRAFERGGPQLGTLGSGNHFLEVQVVDVVYHAPAAAEMGLVEGQITVLIHSGSRGLGHQVCSDYVATFLKAAPHYGIALPDRQLAAAPIESPEGRAYLGAMAAAGNFAFANRQRITAGVRTAFEDIGFTPNDHDLRVVYDLAHNHAKFERHGERQLLVHRKGATRAFGPGHPELPERYRDLGQPVFVPGDMGRYSFVLLGTSTAMRHTFGSSCHGAGRKLSRHRAKKAAHNRDLTAELAEKGIVVRAASHGGVAEEMPEAYKDVADVVGVVDAVGIGRKVARLRPLIVVKG